MNKDLTAMQLMSKGLAQLSSGVRTLSRAVAKLPDPDSIVRLLTGEAGEVYTCGHCEYTTDKKSNLKKHENTLKHQRQIARKIEPGSSLWVQIKQDYRKQLCQEDDKYVLMAYMWLKPHHHRVGVGKQGMWHWMMRDLWELINDNCFDGGFYMKGNKLSIYHHKKTRHQFPQFKTVFDQFKEHARNVIEEANKLIARRCRLFPKEKWDDHWEKYDSSTKNIPMYLKDKTPFQKRKETMSLHEYLQMCG